MGGSGWPCARGVQPAVFAASARKRAWFPEPKTTRWPSPKEMRDPCVFPEPDYLKRVVRSRGLPRATRVTSPPPALASSRRPAACSSLRRCRAGQPRTTTLPVAILLRLHSGTSPPSTPPSGGSYTYPSPPGVPTGGPPSTAGSRHRRRVVVGSISTRSYPIRPVWRPEEGRQRSDCLSSVPASPPPRWPLRATKLTT
jgi:hypothetical protein